MYTLNNINEKIIELNNTNFKYFEDYFNLELVDGYVQKVQSLNTEKKYFKIKIRKEGKNKELIVGEGICFINENKIEANNENKGFSLYLNKLLENKKIKKIIQINLEKILLFEFENYNLYFEFFSNNNIIITDKENKILSQLLKESWKDRNIKKNEIYLPPKNLNNFLEYIPNENDFDINKNLVSNISKNVNINPKILEKYFEKNNINKNLPTYETFKKTINIFKNKFNEKPIYNLKGILLENKFIPVNIDFDFLDDFNFDLNTILNKNFEKIIFKNKNIALGLKDKKIQNILNILKEQENAHIKLLNKAEKYKIIGDFIYKNYLEFENIKNLIKTENIKENSNFEIENKKIVFKKIDKRKQKIVFSIP